MVVPDDVVDFNGSDATVVSATRPSHRDVQLVIRRSSDELLTLGMSPVYPVRLVNPTDREWVHPYDAEAQT
jgi:hypothetical protein